VTIDLLDCFCNAAEGNKICSQSVKVSCHISVSYVLTTSAYYVVSIFASLSRWKLQICAAYGDSGGNSLV